MNSNERILVSVADFEVGTPIAANLDLFAAAPPAIFVAGDDITVCAAGHAGVKSHIQIPEIEIRRLRLSLVKSDGCYRQ